jgi:peptide methionine sulfoxide reductase MsrB
MKTVTPREKEIYLCAPCGSELFGSTAKFESATGWSSFYEPLAKDKIVVLADNTGGIRRQEVRCARCGSDLGKAFNDGPAPDAFALLHEFNVAEIEDDEGSLGVAIMPQLAST